MAGVMSRLFFGWITGSQLAARSGPIILGAITASVIYALAWELFAESRIALRAAALYCLAPIMNALSVVIEPDNSLLLFTALAWLLFWRAVRSGTRLVPWLLCGVGAGLALLSKFHAWVLLPPLYGYLLFSRERRALLARPGPWLAILVALAVLSPNLIWNARNHWINYFYQWHRSDLGESHFGIFHPLIYLFGPAGTLSPLVYGAMIVGAWRGLRKSWSSGDPAVTFLLWAGLPLPVFLGLLSTRVMISLHWPTAGYGALLILTVALMEGGELFGPRYRRWMWGTCLVLTLLLHSVPFLARALPGDLKISLGSKQFDTGEAKEYFVGWRELGEKVRRMRDEMNAQAPTVIMAKGEHLTSLLAFYSQRPKECFTYRVSGSHNYDFWIQERGGLTGMNAVVAIFDDANREIPWKSLEEKYRKPLHVLEALFERVEIVPSLACYADGSIEDYLGFDSPRPMMKEYLVFRGYGFKGTSSE